MYKVRNENAKLNICGTSPEDNHRKPT